MVPLFDGLRRQYDAHVDLLELRGIDKVRKPAFSGFNNVLDISLAIKDYPKSFILRSVFSGYFIKKILSAGNIKSAIRLAVLQRRMLPEIKKYDVISVQFITPELFDLFDAIASAKKICVTFWGSDLFQNNRDFNILTQSRLIRIASAVTVHHKEMQDIFLSKFGREYENITHAVLPVSDKDHLQIFGAEAPRREQHIARFKHRHNIASHKRIVVVGHSAHALDNHISIATALLSFKDELYDRICFVLPMTYGAHNEQYYDEVEAAYKQLGCQRIILRQFLTNEEMLELRLASEVLIRLSKMDAFSWSLCETLCAGNVVIAGAWLPYGKLRGNGVIMQEVYEIEDVGEKLLDVLDNYDEYKKGCDNNPVNTKNVFVKENAVEKFYKIFADE